MRVETRVTQVFILSAHYFCPVLTKTLTYQRNVSKTNIKFH
jgi:hypothetical protein